MRRVSAPGKVILAGEHAVVYGYPALVAAVGLRCRVKVEWREDKQVVIKDKYKDLGLAKYAVEVSLKEMGKESKGVEVEIESELAVGGGMGSSAAMATVVVWGLMEGYSEAVKNRVVKMVEDKQHGNSSGIDQTIVREGGVIKYQREVGFKKLSIDLPEFLLIDSGKPVESTGEMVKMVGEKKKQYQDIFKQMGEISEKWRVRKIKENQRLLEKIEVVGEKAKKMVREIEVVGGMAKVCGAGGVKIGSGILLSWHKEIERLKELCKEKGWRYFQVELGVEGVRDE